MKKFRFIFCFIMVLILAGCSGQKNVLYFQDMTQKDKSLVTGNYDLKITYDDLLSINVHSRNPELTTPFTLQSGSSGSSSVGGIEYLVNSEGDIDFPILGKLHVEGMTRMELTNYIKNRLIDEDYIKDPIVTVRFLNFKISVLGDVGGPGTINVSTDRITILEAISKAGDISLTGKRDRVTVIREENGDRVPYYVDLTSKDLFESPCFYLKQNDLVYVEPNGTKTRQNNYPELKSITTWTSLISFGISIVTLIFVAD